LQLFGECPTERLWLALFCVKATWKIFLTQLEYENNAKTSAQAQLIAILVIKLLLA